MLARYSVFKRLLHWGIFFSFLVLAYTETMNMYFYSKESIMKSFEYSFAMLGHQDIPPLDRLFIARLERREAWMWHYYAGIVFLILSFIRFFVFLIDKNRANQILHTLLFLIIATQFVTGLSLWIYPHIYEWQNTTRSLHHYATYALYIVIITHISKVLYLEITHKKSNIISKMIGGEK